MNWRNNHNQYKRSKLELNHNIEENFPHNVPPELRWSFYCNYKTNADGVKNPTATFLWVIAKTQEEAILEAEKQVKQISGGRLGFILRGFIDGSGKESEKFQYITNDKLTELV